MADNLGDRKMLNRAGALTGLCLVGILAFLAWALVFREIPQANREAMNWLMAILSAQVGLVVGYYFGSTLHTKQQGETLDKLADTARTATSAATADKQPPQVVVPPGSTIEAKSTLEVRRDEPDSAA